MSPFAATASGSHSHHHLLHANNLFAMPSTLSSSTVFVCLQTRILTVLKSAELLGRQNLLWQTLAMFCFSATIERVRQVFVLQVFFSEKKNDCVKLYFAPDALHQWLGWLWLVTQLAANKIQRTKRTFILPQGFEHAAKVLARFTELKSRFFEHMVNAFSVKTRQSSAFILMKGATMLSCMWDLQARQRKVDSWRTKSGAIRQSRMAISNM